MVVKIYYNVDELRRIFAEEIPKVLTRRIPADDLTLGIEVDEKGDLEELWIETDISLEDIS